MVKPIHVIFFHIWRRIENIVALKSISRRKAVRSFYARSNGLFIHSYIHPFIFFSLSRGQVVVAAAGSNRHPSLQILLGEPKVFPGQMGYVIPPASSGSTPDAQAPHSISYTYWVCTRCGNWYIVSFFSLVPLRSHIVSSLWTNCCTENHVTTISHWSISFLGNLLTSMTSRDVQ